MESYPAGRGAEHCSGRRVAAFPMEGLGQPEEVAGVVAFLDPSHAAYHGGRNQRGWRTRTSLGSSSGFEPDAPLCALVKRERMADLVHRSVGTRRRGTSIPRDNAQNDMSWYLTHAG
jgi:hypothetical protein